MDVKILKRKYVGDLKDDIKKLIEDGWTLNTNSFNSCMIIDKRSRDTIHSHTVIMTKE